MATTRRKLCYATLDECLHETQKKDQIFNSTFLKHQHLKHLCKFLLKVLSIAIYLAQKNIL